MRAMQFLSVSENRVLGLVLAGRGPHRIARRMGISVHTVRAHIAHLRLKLGAGSIAGIRERVHLSEAELLAQFHERERKSLRWQKQSEQDYESKQAESDLQFYRQLRTEDQISPCRNSNCCRGSIRNSVFCRSHHFEMIYRRACPFEGDA